ncbi:hypothetical protein DL762_008770 [Monosporascus cannonballus]|uniref:Uncharacterized protein n=1 Tax=Monosporascus cannonballus TaxID=155416 RepID=A0ABY0GZP8_9PEZI|nr:hypothetical protein DL762_008770 [Monosporascus cannonballus]
MECFQSCYLIEESQRDSFLPRMEIDGIDNENLAIFLPNFFEPVSQNFQTTLESENSLGNSDSFPLEGDPSVSSAGINDDDPAAFLQEFLKPGIVSQDFQTTPESEDLLGNNYVSDFCTNYWASGFTESGNCESLDSVTRNSPFVCEFLLDEDTPLNKDASRDAEVPSAISSEIFPDGNVSTDEDAYLGHCASQHTSCIGSSASESASPDAEGLPSTRLEDTWSITPFSKDPVETPTSGECSPANSAHMNSGISNVDPTSHGDEITYPAVADDDDDIVFLSSREITPTPSVSPSRNPAGRTSPSTRTRKRHHSRLSSEERESKRRKPTSSEEPSSPGNIRSSSLWSGVFVRVVGLSLDLGDGTETYAWNPHLRVNGEWPLELTWNMEKEKFEGFDSIIEKFLHVDPRVMEKLVAEPDIGQEI